MDDKWSRHSMVSHSARPAASRGADTSLPPTRLAHRPRAMRRVGHNPMIGHPSNPTTSVNPSRRRRLYPAGNYRQLARFQTATLIHDATVWFCEKFLDPRSRTVDQMVQAARSGRQNIAEGRRFGATSSQTELRLVNTARSSLEELLLDYEDYLRHRHHPKWDPASPEARAVRAVARGSNLPELTDPERWELYAPWLAHADPTIRANAIICLIHQGNYLLDQQLAALEEAFIEEGGYSEQLATARLTHRTHSRRLNPQAPPDRPDPADPIPNAHNAPNPWPCEPPRPAPTPPANSGAAPATPPAGAQRKFEHRPISLIPSVQSVKSVDHLSPL